jgi:hypothetical protein
VFHYEIALELELMVKAGVSSAAALRAATLLRGHAWMV